MICSFLRYDNSTMESRKWIEDLSESIVTDGELHFLETNVRNIRDRLEKTYGNFEDEKLKSSLESLKSLVNAFFIKLSDLGDHWEYLAKKEKSSFNRAIKDWLKLVARYKKSYKYDLTILETIEKEIEILFRSGKVSMDENTSQRELVAKHRGELEKLSEGIRVREDRIKQQRWALYLLLALEWSRSAKESDKILKECEKFVKKYEYEFWQLQKRAQKIFSLRIEVERMIEEENSKQDTRVVESEHKSKEETVPDSVVRVEKSMPEELKNLFDELCENNVNSSRLRTLLWKRYDQDRIIPSRFLNEWIQSYKLNIKLEKLKWILSKVFTIEEEKKEWGEIKLDWKVVTEEVVNRREGGDMIEVENGDLLEKLQGIYRKLKNREVEAEEFYRCFFDILRECLSLTIEDEWALIKQFKSFEKHNYFHMDILRVWENIIRKKVKPTIIRKSAMCAKTWKVIRFPTGSHSKVRIIITDDDRIVWLYSREDYIRYFGWCRT